MPAISFDVPCACCGASLAGLDLGARCTRCGSAVGETLNLAVIDTDAMKLAGDAMCVGCGYNLRTLPIASVCPECATPVHRSLHPDDLRFANPYYLGRVRRGVTFLLVAALGVVGSMLLWFLPVSLFWLTPSIAGSFVGAPLFCCGFFSLVLGLVVLGCVGVFQVTASEPYRTQPASRTAERVARGCTLVPPIIALLAVVGGFSVLAQLPISTWLTVLLIAPWALIAVGLLLAACAVIALAVCLRRLARRARQRGLARLTTAVLRLAVVWAVVVPFPIILQGVLFLPIGRATITAVTTAPAPSPTTATATATGPATGTQQYGFGTTISTSAGVPTATGPVVTTPLPAMFQWSPSLAVLRVLSCAAMLIGLAVYVTGVTALLGHRRMLAAALAGNAHQARAW